MTLNDRFASVMTTNPAEEEEEPSMDRCGFPICCSITTVFVVLCRYSHLVFVKVVSNNIMFHPCRRIKVSVPDAMPIFSKIESMQVRRQKKMLNINIYQI